MTVRKYSKTTSDDMFLCDLNNQIDPVDTLTSVDHGSLDAISIDFIDVSGNAQDDLDGAMAERGYAPIDNEVNVLIGTHHFGKFTTATAPTTTIAGQGDLGYDTTLGVFVTHDGSAWNSMATEQYVDDAVAVEDLWDRAVTTLSPKNAGDDVSTTGDIYGAAGTFTSNLTVDGQLRAAIGSEAAPEYSFTTDSTTGMYLPSSEELAFSVAGSHAIWIWSDAMYFYKAIQGPNGTESIPTYSFEVSSNTGMFRPAANEIGFSTNGTERIRIDSSGDLDILTGDLIVDTDTLYVDVSEDRVGVNTSSPDYELDVHGDAGFVNDKQVLFTSGNFGNGNTTDLYFNHADVGFNQSSFVLYNQNNNTSANRYFRLFFEDDKLYWADDDDENRGIFIRYGGNIGIGQTTPAADLDIKGNNNVATTGTLSVVNASPTVTTTADLTSYFNVGDAILIVNTDPEETSVYTIDAITSTTITLDSNYEGTTDSTGTAIAYRDSNLLRITDGDGNIAMTITKSKEIRAEGTYPILDQRVDYNQTSGWLFGGEVTVNGGDNTLIDIAAGTIRLVDYATDTTSRIPEFTTISWDAQTAVDPGTFGRSIWVGVEDDGSGGAQFRFDVGLTPTILRSTGVLCRLLSNTGDGQISSVLDFERPAWGLTNAMQDFILQFGSYTIDGNKFTPNNSNLLLDRGSGSTWRYHTSDTKGEENVHTESAATGITAYNYHLQGSDTTTLETDIDPDNYDLSGTKTSVTTDYWTIQEVWYFPTSGTTHVLYGQDEYSSKVAAIIGLDIEDKVRNTEILDGAIFRTYIIVQQGSTNLNEAIIVQEPVVGKPSKGQGRVPGFTSKSYAISDYGSTDTFYTAGFYEAPTAAANLTIGATTTQTLGTANKGEGAHAFAVFDGLTDSGLTLTVSGTSITDTGVRTTSDSEVLVNETIPAEDAYLETTKKWLGQITYTLTGSSGTMSFNYGFSKYEDFGNRDFTATDFEITALAGNTASDMNVELLYHSSNGWSYNLTGFVPGGNVICSMETDYSTDDGIVGEENFAYKRSNLSTDVEGSGQEGVLVRLTQTTNNAIRYGTVHIGVLI